MFVKNLGRGYGATDCLLSPGQAPLSVSTETQTKSPPPPKAQSALESKAKRVDLLVNELGEEAWKKVYKNTI